MSPAAGNGREHPKKQSVQACKRCRCVKISMSSRPFQAFHCDVCSQCHSFEADRYYSDLERYAVTVDTQLATHVCQARPRVSGRWSLIEGGGSQPVSVHHPCLNNQMLALKRSRRLPASTPQEVGLRSRLTCLARYHDTMKSRLDQGRGKL
jgi:hypothetical protein